MSYEYVPGENCVPAGYVQLPASSPGKGRFLAFQELQDALIRNIGVIGEAEHAPACPSSTGSDICGMRDVLIHDYEGVDLEEVWNVAAASARRYFPR